MLRSRDWALFLEVVGRTIAEELRPDLRSSHARKSADYLIEVLNRLIAEARDGERMAGDHVERWVRLAARGPGDTFDGTLVEPEILGSRQTQLARATASIQRSLAHSSTARNSSLEESSGRGAWFKDAAAAALDYWQAIEDGVRPFVAQSEPRSGGLDVEALRSSLSRYFASRFDAMASDPIRTFAIVPGGNAKRTAIFSIDPGRGLPERLVLRQDIPMSLTGTSTVDEYPLLMRLHGLGLKVPQPVLLECDATILGGAFMIVEEITDAVPAGTYFAEDRARLPMMIGPQFGRDAARELARLHRLTAVDEFDVDAVCRRLRQAVEAACERWNSLDKPPNSVAIDLGFDWLLRQRLARDRPRCLIHGDYGVHNMMASDQRLAAVLDWELAEEDDPAIDLAEVRMMMVQDTIPWEEFAATYVAAGGDPRACDPDAVNYYCVWMYTVKYGLMMAGGWNAFVQGLRTDSLMAAVASQSMDRILFYCARALAIATQEPQKGDA
jgi:aminoglycoside phosphotransferase (APT) family kinase protein